MTSGLTRPTPSTQAARSPFSTVRRHADRSTAPPPIPGIHTESRPRGNPPPGRIRSSPSIPVATCGTVRSGSGTAFGNRASRTRRNSAMDDTKPPAMKSFRRARPTGSCYSQLLRRWRARNPRTFSGAGVPFSLEYPNISRRSRAMPDARYLSGKERRSPEPTRGVRTIRRAGKQMTGSGRARPWADPRQVICRSGRNSPPSDSG